MMKWVIAALVAAVAVAVPVAAQAADTVYVMRHLQKASGEDPPLTEEGAILAEMGLTPKPWSDDAPGDGATAKPPTGKERLWTLVALDAWLDRHGLTGTSS